MDKPKVKLTPFKSVVVQGLIIGTVVLVWAQSGCPNVPNWVIGGIADRGVQNGATAVIYVAGALANATASNQISGVWQNWAGLPGANFTYSVLQVSEVPHVTASAQTPVITYEYGDPSMFAAGGACAGGDACTAPPQVDSQGHVMTGLTWVNPNRTPDYSYFKIEMDHETAHTFGLLDCIPEPNAGFCNSSDTIMASPPTTSVDPGLSGCDQEHVYTYSGGEYGVDPNGSSPPGGQCPDANCELCDTSGSGGNCQSPIVVDLDGSNFPLSSLHEGVHFDLNADGTVEKTSWTTPSSLVAFLSLDRNGNGIIDNGTELFGNHTPQPTSTQPNGFLALTQYDTPENGGNGNGTIDPGDAIFNALRLWIDSNHDGVSQASELHSLSEFGITYISLDYRVSYRQDRYGNQFRYRAKIGSTDSGLCRWAYDVFFVTDSSNLAMNRRDNDLTPLWNSLRSSPRNARISNSCASLR